MTRNHLRLHGWTAAFVCILAFCGTLYSQGLGTILGTVTDPSGALVPGATVKITEEGTSLARSATTDVQGYYVIPSLRPGSYTLSVETQGFSSYSRTGVILQADQSLTVNVSVSLQQSSQQITVEAPPPQVDTSTSALSAVVDSRRIVDLPLNGRNAASLMLITAGTVLGPPTGVDEGNSKTFPATQAVSANGSRQNQTSYRLDGSANNDIYTNTNQPFPFPDALQEFSVQTSNYSAKYGGNAGGVVNIVTKSGANEAHGDLFEFNRNAVFNARNFFAPQRDQLKRNQFGGTVGGPVSLPHLYNGKNKTFFFAGYQGSRIRNTGQGNAATVPTPDVLNNGDFSLVSPGKTLIDPTNGQPFANNRIPITRFDPASVALTKYLPSAVGTGQIFYASPISQSFDEIVSRVDHTISDHDRLSFRYFFDRFNNAPYLDLKDYLSAQNFTTIKVHNGMVNQTHTFSANFFNDFRFSVAQEVSDRGPADGSINVKDLGSNIYQPPGFKTIQSISVSGGAAGFSIAQQNPATFTRDQYTLNDSIYLVKGSHSLVFGVDANRAWILIRNQFNGPGTFSFDPTVTNSSMASFMLGYMHAFVQGNGEYKDNRVNNFGMFVQDDWHVARKLTLNLGLRYDPFFPWKETKDRFEIFKPDAYARGIRSQVFVNAPPGLLFAGDTGIPQYGLKSNWKNWGPRVGFAYDVTGDGRTSIRGGAGVFFDSQQNGIYNNRFVDLAPFSFQVNQTGTASSPLLGSFSNPYAGQVSPFPSPYPPPHDFVFLRAPTFQSTSTSYDPANGLEYQTPVSYAWNLTVERQFAADWLVRVAYVGSHASHLLETLQLSPKVFGSSKNFYPEYSDLQAAAQDINSSYNSLQVTLQKRLSRGFTVLANYTWSKSIDDLPFGQSITTVGTGSISPIPWYLAGRHQFDRGPSEFDRQHRLVGTFVWDLPKLTASAPALRHVVGGWQLTGLFSAQSGPPFTVNAGKDISGTATGQDRGVYVSGQNPYGPGACAGTTAICVDYLNPAAFALPAAGTYGNVGKGALRGPNQITMDAGLFKEISLRERLKFQFRAEFFNLFNRVNFYPPGAALDASRNNEGIPNNQAALVSAANFGSMKAAFDPRIGQLALKLVF